MDNLSKIFDLTKLEVREKLTETLQEVESRIHQEFAEKIYQRFSDLEKEIQTWVDSIELVGGSWFRPYHNYIVTLSMKALLKNEKQASGENYNYACMLAAQMHDIGYSGFKLKNTANGAAWDQVDIRKGHMLLGAQMALEKLTEIRKLDKLNITTDEINLIHDLILVHDNPYIGVELTSENEKLLRDADRSFVLTFLSLFKDSIAHAADCQGNNSQASFHSLFEQRCFEFHYSNDFSHKAIDSIRIDEPTAYTKTGKEIIDKMIRERKKDLQAILSISTIEQFKILVESSLRKDFIYFYELSS